MTKKILKKGCWSKIGIFRRVVSSGLYDCVSEPLFQVIKARFQGTVMLNILLSGYGIVGPCLGQAGFVKDRESDRVLFVTAKHNHVSRPFETFNVANAVVGGIASISLPLQEVLASTITPLVYLSKSSGLMISWKYGEDVTILENVEIPRCGRVFDLVPEDFDLEIGAQIAMAIRFTELSRPTVETSKALRVDGSVDLDDMENKYFGPPETFCVYTGKIVDHGEKHIEHDINSFKGCSGAIIFLLEGLHAGKAIAVHVGSPSQTKTSLGIKL